MRNKWSYDAQAKAIQDYQDRLVLYSDDINDQVLQEVCQMWNGNEDVKQIQKVLDKSDLCTIEESDYIMEQIGNYQQQVPVTSEAVRQEEEFQDINDKVYPKEAKMTEEKIEPVVKKQRKTREVPSVKNVSSGKILSSEDVIKQLKAQQEKTNKLISAIEWIDCSTNGVNDEMPEGLHKEAIELLIKYSKEIARIKSEYIQQMQAL